MGRYFSFVNLFFLTIMYGEVGDGQKSVTASAGQPRSAPFATRGCSVSRRPPDSPEVPPFATFGCSLSRHPPYVIKYKSTYLQVSFELPHSKKVSLFSQQSNFFIVALRLTQALLYFITHFGFYAQKKTGSHRLFKI